MTTEAISEVAVPTDQPLISKDLESEAVEMECEVEDQKSEKNAATPQKNEKDEKSATLNNHLSKAKCNASTSLSTSGASTSKNNKLGPTEPPMAKSQSEVHVCVTSSLSVSQTSKNSLMTFSSSGTFYDHTTTKKKVDLRVTPKRVPHSNGKDATDFRQMEQGLLQLLKDFHSGKLEAFGQDCTFEKMENVREQQERLARLHFDLNTQQELCGQHTEEGIKMSKKNLSKLTENLHELSRSIEQLQSTSPASQADV